MQGTESAFRLKPQLLSAACENAGVPLTLRLQPGYDHSYAFMATFVEDHLSWHAERLAKRPSSRRSSAYL